MGTAYDGGNKHQETITRAAIRLNILIAITGAIKISNHNYLQHNNKHKFVAQNNSIIHDISSIARRKCQQNILPTEIKTKTSN